MADVKISALPAATQANLTDLLAKVDATGPTTQKLTNQQLYNLILATLAAATPLALGQVTANLLTARLKGSGANPTIVPNASAGIGATTTVDATSTDTAGQITLTPAGTPAAGVIFTLTFATPYTTAPYVVFSAANAQAALLNQMSGWNVVVTVNGFSINARIAPSAGAAYLMNYIVIQ